MRTSSSSTKQPERSVPQEQPGLHQEYRDDNPTRYVTGSNVSSSLLADGCIIEGTVENCVLFRGVKVKKGAVVKNCVLMQDTVIEPDVELSYVVTDKNVRITAGKKLSGTDSFPVYVQKSHMISISLIGAASSPVAPRERGGGFCAPPALFRRLHRRPGGGGVQAALELEGEYP